MPFPTVLALASGPVIVLLHVIWSIDKRKEPFRNVLKYLAIGGLTVVPGYYMEVYALAKIGDPTADPANASIVGLLVASLLGIALVEEWVKLKGVMLFGAKDAHLDEAFDWVVYSVTVALGFAFVENVKYVIAYGPEVAISRALFAVPAHALNGTLMGYRLARAATAPEHERGKQRLLALWEPVAWHGVYDFLAFAMSSRSEEAPIPGSAFAWAFGVLVIVQWIRCVQLVRGLVVEGQPTPPVLYPLTATRYVRRRMTKQGSARS